MLLEMAEHEGEIAPYPVQNELTKGIRAAARKQDRPEFMSLWVGQAVRLVRPTKAAELVKSVVDEAEVALGGLVRRSR